MVDVMQYHRQRRPITTFVPRIKPWMYLTIYLLSAMGSHTITNQYYEFTFVGTVVMAAQQHMFGRINCIATSKSHLIHHDLRGGDQSSNNDSSTSTDLDRNNIPSVNIDGVDSASSSIDTEIETKLSQSSNNETIPDVVTESKQYNDDETNDDTDDRHNGIPNETVDNDHRSVDDDHDAPIAGSESVGVMSPIKKSNAVGDPDGDDDDDDDDENDDEDENEEDVYVLDDDEEELSLSTATSTAFNNSDDTDATDLFSIDERDDDAVVERVQVEVEYTIEEEDDKDEDDDINVVAMSTNSKHGTSSSRDNNQRSKNMGGVGVRSFGQRFKNRNKRRNNNHDSTKSDLMENTSKMEQQFVEAWQSYIFYPPPLPPPVTMSNNSSFWQYLQQHYPAMDTDGKLRLDRRTLYSGILAEFSTSVYTVKNNKRSNRRKFLDTETSQALQAAVSLATQPIWRKSLQQRPNAIRLYDIRNSENEPKNMIRDSSSTTLAMQETITLGLVCTIFFL